MELMRWNPTTCRASNAYHRLFEDFFSPVHHGLSGGTRNWHPVVDVYENEDHYVIKADLPGVSKKDISIEVKEGVLFLSGERATDAETKEERYYRRESVRGRFERRFALAADIDPEKIAAEYADGVLKIEIPKPEVQKPKQITIH